METARTTSLKWEHAWDHFQSHPQGRSGLGGQRKKVLLAGDEREDSSEMGWMGLKGSTAEIVLTAHLAPCQAVLGKRLLGRDGNRT